ncbi:HYR domain protein [Phycisphaerae bacterium RAS1]|nr:HYR domain protein [Phycisphaerae bacterium RAS1]
MYRSSTMVADVQSRTATRAGVRRAALVLMIAGPMATALAQPTLTRIVRSFDSGRDPVPGRPAPFVFRGEQNTRAPVLNDRGEVVFRARSASSIDNSGAEFGLYAYRPCDAVQPLIRLVDSTLTGVNPTFVVPGQAAGSRFLDFAIPVLNNAGDVVFRAAYNEPGVGSQSGLFAMSVNGGAIVQLVDTGVAAPLGSYSTFQFSAGGLTDLTLAGLTDSGVVVFWARYSSSAHVGLFATTVAGGAIVPLVNTSGSFVPVGTGLPTPGEWVDTRPEFSLSDNGVVAFRGTLRASPGGGVFRDGVFSVPAASGTVQTVAFQFQPAPSAAGVSYSSFGGGPDINESGDVAYVAALSDGRSGMYRGTAAGGPQVRVMDTRPGSFVVPGEIAGAAFDTVSFAPLGEDLNQGFFSFIRLGFPNNRGYYYYDPLAGISRVVDTQIAAPGLSLPARLTFGSGAEGAGINDAGNLIYPGSGTDGVGPLLGLYYFDAALAANVRIADSTNALAVLGDTFTFSGVQTTKFGVHISHANNSGRHRSLNNREQVAFTAQFDNFDFGVYLWSYSGVGGSGEVEITCPADITVECGANTSPAGAGSATAVDTCSGAAAAVSFSDVFTPACGSTGVITRTWSADNGGTPVTCVQTITIEDTIAPALALPPDTSSACDASPDPTNTGFATAADLCDAAPELTYADAVTPGSCPGESTITRTWTATDDCGNAASATQVIAVGNDATPVLTVPADVSVGCLASTDPSATGAATATTPCDPNPTITYSDSTVAGSCTAESVITRTWTVTDGCGNTTSAMQTIHVVDEAAPTITPPTNADVGCDEPSDPAATGFATASDDCGEATVSYQDVILPGACDASYSIIRSWIATDACGNSASTVQFIFVSDTAAPIISVPADVIVECGDSTEPSATGEATVSDGCSPIATLGHIDSEAPGACAGSRIITRAWSASDACGNAITQNQTITVLDRIAPTLSVPPDVTIVCGDSADTSLTGAATASDVCDPAPIVSFLDNTEPGVCPIASVIVRTWTAADACGNTSSGSQRISLIDTVAPEIQCPPDVTVVVEPGECEATLDLGFATATDLCSEPSVTSNAPAVFPVGVTYVLWTATDACGNSTTCTQTVTVEDEQAPVIKCWLATTMLWPPNHDLTPVGLCVHVCDACESGIPPLVTVYSDEDDEEPTGDGLHSPDARNIAPGTLRLRRERRGDSDGRVYLIVVQATDSSGNTAMTACTVVVPHSRSPHALRCVMVQAHTAHAYFNLMHAPPPGFVLVGDGPVIGPKQ